MSPESRYTAEYYLIRSSLCAQRGDAVAWRANSTLAIELFQRADVSDHLKKTVFGSLAVQALHLGESELAASHQRKSLDLAIALHADEAYARAVMARVELRRGKIATARTLMQEVGTARFFLPKMAVATAGAELARAIGDDKLLNAYMDVALIDEALAGGASSTAITLAAAFVPAYWNVGGTQKPAACCAPCARRYAQESRRRLSWPRSRCGNPMLPYSCARPWRI
ncbi:MAG: hypothetical protein GIX03_15690 [Candidatus Eremiobacteraeota bacterium]|nr:hypothetical protein [Candidatus Eremiobacteraeota bacterium]MBC5804407.1 hypothetical protein [Candidatus Eremiobacteraeota bacterium]MBC5821362.1 hypothetical protein [Candidatus Eremiobacteraeota bacterium]